MGVAPLRSTSILPKVILPLYSPASSSTIGAIARQGPHQAAQKSINTGLSDFNTSESKLASVTSTMPLLAIHPPRFASAGTYEPNPGEPYVPRVELSILAPFIRCSEGLKGARAHPGRRLVREPRKIAGRSRFFQR